MNMEIKQYQDYVHQGLVNRSPMGKPMDPDSIILEMVGELGEVLNAYKHARRWPDPSDMAEDHLVEELGDLLWYIFAVCDTLGFKVEHIAKNNIQKLDARYGKK